MKYNEKKAIVLGASGLVGNALIQQLILDDNYTKIILLVRRKLDLDSVKITQEIINFDKLDSFKEKIKGDVLFSTFGTTLKTAGSKQAQYKIDYTYQFEIAKIAAENDVRQYVLVSSAGANEKSANFYTQMKGKLDAAVQKLGFEQVIIIKPSFLEGNRTEVRLGDRLIIPLANIILPIFPFFKKYRPISVEIVAKAMRMSVLDRREFFQIFELEQIFNLTKL